MKFLRDVLHFYRHNSKDAFPVTFGWGLISAMLLWCSTLMADTFPTILVKDALFFTLTVVLLFMVVMTVGGIGYRLKDLWVKRKGQKMQSLFSVWSSMFGMLFGEMSVTFRKIFLIVGLIGLAFSCWIWTVPTVTGIGLILKVIIGLVVTVYAFGIFVSGIAGFVLHKRKNQPSDSKESTHEQPVTQ